MLQMSEILALIAIVMSVAFSILSVWFSYKTFSEASASQTIWSQYERFANIVQAHIDHSQFGHLFTVPECYATVLKQVNAAIQDLSPQERLRLQLQERAMADYLFNEFEQSFYQIHRVRQRFDAQSCRFFEEVLDYFTLRLLRNPRLLYYWAEDGGKLHCNYEPSTIAFYESKVLKNPSFPLEFDPDPIGPFAESALDSENDQPQKDDSVAGTA